MLDTELKDGLFMREYVHPGTEQPIYLCLAFNRGLETDVARLDRLGVGGAYVISCAHNEQATSGVRGPEHINSKFGSRRFLQSLRTHFEDTIRQPLRVDTIFMDWHWLQSGGDHWILGYLSGSHGSKAYHLLKTTVPTLAKDSRQGGADLQHVYLPIDEAGFVHEALVTCRKELADAGMCLELISAENLNRNPLYHATMKVNALVLDRSSREMGTNEHLKAYCNAVFPFAHLFATRDRSRRSGGMDKQWAGEIERLAAVSKRPDSD